MFKGLGMKTKCCSATVVQKLNQGTGKGMSCFIPFLNFRRLSGFFGGSYFLFFKKKKVTSLLVKRLEIKQRLNIAAYLNDIHSPFTLTTDNPLLPIHLSPVVSDGGDAIKRYSTRE